MSRKSSGQTPHDRALSTIERLVADNLGRVLEATVNCNECGERLPINLLERVSSVGRETSVGRVRPDISLHDEAGVPVRFIEVVDSHAPESNVHEYAIQNEIEVLEVHLRADREFVGTRRNRALDSSLTVKTRLQELREGRVHIDAHNLLCRRPKCGECGTPLPLRTVTVSTKDCWNCGHNVNVVTGDKDGESLEQDYFSVGEITFAEQNGVTLERRFSATVGGKYLANVCTNCDQIQGNWFLYEDPFHDRFHLKRSEKREYGPCDRCATFYCLTHGEYLDYRGTDQCPDCQKEAERVMCPHNTDRDCFYPERCDENGCYFLTRELRGLAQEEESGEQERPAKERREHQHEELQLGWADFQE